VSETISADPELVRAAMKRLSNVSEIIEAGRKELPPEMSQCVAVPEVAAGFQTAFELAIERINAVASGTQVQLAGNAQNIWKVAEEFNAVDADIADALVKTEGTVADLNAVPVSTVDQGGTPVATTTPSVYVTAPTTTAAPAAGAPTVGDTGGDR